MLDYAGHYLNLASRLTDLARPRGIVMDGGFALQLLPDEQQGLFEEEQVYLPSVAEERLRAVYIQSGVVELSEAARHPLRLEEWERRELKMTHREWNLLGPSNYWLTLQKRLKRPDGIRATMFFPLYRKGKRVRGHEKWETVPFDYQLQAGRPSVALDLGHMLARLTSEKIPRTATVRVVVEYVPE